MADVVVAFPAEFSSLEEDFVESKMAINNSINDILDEGASPTAIQMAQVHVVEAQRCMKLMSIEVRGKSPALRKAMQAKINLYREELQGLMRDVERAQLMSKERSQRTRTAEDTNVRETREVTGEARRILQRMMRRAITNTIVLYTIIAVLVVSICVVIYQDFIKPTRESFFGI
ncbi:hypothetical protein ATCC90586_003511 [Pythium insidiosum]|nr:hypothetical protein ATCC90586_003511 [Pythium insidiosum]